jgi:hypothetical protein
MHAKRVSAAFAFVGLCALGLVVLFYWRPLWLQDQCLDSGGRWMASQRSCQSSSCVDSGSCLPSYNNTTLCEALRPGTTERELITQLGQPIARKEREVLFAPGATERGPIRIKLDAQNRGEEFFCRGP